MAGRRAPAPSLPQETKVVVPKLNKDPTWSLKPWPVTVTVQGRDFTIAAMPASDWLAVLMAQDLSADDILQELLPDLEEYIYEAELSLDEVYEVCLDVIATVTARPWWVALRLVAVARDNWHVICDDMLLYDADRLPLSAWLDVLLLVVLKRMENSKTTMFLLQLETPPPEVEEEAEEIEMSMAEFHAIGAD